MVVLGVGSVLTGDDALGPTVVRMLSAGYDLGPDVEALDAGTPGMDLATLIGDAEALIVVDTVLAPGEPGSLATYDRAQLLSRPLEPRVNPHAPGLLETLWALDFAGMGPSWVRFVGVVPGRTDVGVGLTRAVQEALPRALDAVLAALAEAGFPATVDPTPSPPDLWWESAARGEFIPGSGTTAAGCAEP
jgi:hydrogenase maturation protease